jgi:hypothetical protein
MRPSFVLPAALVCLCACAAAPRGRGGGAPLRAQDPRLLAARGERHIDDREPPPREPSRRPFGVPAVVPERDHAVEVGFGDLRFRASGTGLDDRASATWARLRLDGDVAEPRGAGFWLTGVRSDDDLFGGGTIANGLGAADAGARALGFDAFPHLRFDVAADGRWHVPLRVGVFVDWIGLDHVEADVERDWFGFGPRLEVGPACRVFADAGQSLDLVGRLGVDAGGAWFREHWATGDDGDFTARCAGEVGAGLRFASGAFHAELGCRLRHVLYGEVDSALFGSPDRSTLLEQQWFVGIGVAF